MQRLLNLGCGSRYCTDLGWTNVDFKGTVGAVIAHDLARGVPFADCTFDAVYHSNVLEHFSIQDGARFMRECVRVLKPGGIVRVAVPDTEEICREYLNALDRAMQGDGQARHHHRWMIIELCDQLARHYPGGEMAAYLNKMEVPERSFVIRRIGNIAKSLLPCEEKPQRIALRPKSSWRRQCWQRTVRKLIALRRMALSLLLKRHELEALKVGLFRLHGEPHLWIYDRFSLSEIMREAGLENIEMCTAASSRIMEWERYYLDTNADGSEHQPDSLYMEGVKLA